MPRKSDPERPLPLPIKLDPCSNGEYSPRPRSPSIARAQRLAHQLAEEGARRLGVSRRAFLESSCGVAAVLVALNQVTGCAGGRYAVTRETMRDRTLADATIQGDEFVFDVQTHHVDVDRDWYEADRPNMGPFLRRTAQPWCDEPSWVQCYSRDRYVREIFMNSDTDLAVLSTLWGDEEINANTIEGLAQTRERLDQLGKRLRIQGIVLPEAHSPARTDERMQALAEEWRVSAWKLYPVWGPEDAIWYGSPQDQIQALRAFEITPELQERHGYPALTPDIKAKIHGLNAARVYGVDPAEIRAASAGDELSRAREEHLARAGPSFTTYGPRSRRELLALTRARGGKPD